jgi:hypothetical protein
MTIEDISAMSFTVKSLGSVLQQLLDGSEDQFAVYEPSVKEYEAAARSSVEAASKWQLEDSEFIAEAVANSTAVLEGLRANITELEAREHAEIDAIVEGVKHRVVHKLRGKVGSEKELGTEVKRWSNTI